MIYINGEFVSPDKAQISVFDRGFLFGDGVYEVVPIINGKSFLFSEHILRLKNSLSEIDMPIMEDDFASVLSQLLKSQPPHFNGMIYIQISRGKQNVRNHKYVGEELKPTVIAFLQEVQFAKREQLEKGFAAITKEDFRWTKCHIKSTSLLPNILIKAEADKNNCLEVILYREGVVTEATASNVFIVKNEKVYTHPANSYILNGITRQYVIKKLKDLNLPIEETPFPINEIENADEIWVASSTKFVAPIVRLNEKPVSDGVPGKTWTRIIEEFEI